MRPRQVKCKKLWTAQKKKRKKKEVKEFPIVHQIDVSGVMDGQKMVPRIRQCAVTTFVLFLSLWRNKKMELGSCVSRPWVCADNPLNPCSLESGHAAYVTKTTGYGHRITHRQLFFSWETCADCFGWEKKCDHITTLNNEVSSYTVFAATCRCRQKVRPAWVLWNYREEVTDKWCTPLRKVRSALRIFYQEDVSWHDASLLWAPYWLHMEAAQMRWGRVQQSFW